MHAELPTLQWTRIADLTGYSMVHHGPPLLASLVQLRTAWAPASAVSDAALAALLPQDWWPHGVVGVALLNRAPLHYPKDHACLALVLARGAWVGQSERMVGTLGVFSNGSPTEGLTLAV